jgi:hypothetical protein
MKVVPMVEESLYSTLAEILTSKKVGIAHIRLTGELLVAHARLNEWIVDRGNKPIPMEHRLPLIDDVLAWEDRCMAAWAVVDSSETIDREALDDLQTALREAAAAFRARRDELEAGMDG